MSSGAAYALDGLVLGVAAGMSPGPLLALVIAQSLRFGTREGVKVAFVPLVTDAPAVVVGLGAIGVVARYGLALGFATLAGALVVFYLAYESYHASPPAMDSTAGAPRSVLRGMLVNVFSPNPYLFWLAVGAPIAIRAWHAHAFAALAFVGLFYVGLVGAKCVVAFATGTSRTWITGARYVIVMRVLALALAIFGCRLLWDAFRLAVGGP